ncbi:MAG: hypothetical protein GF383_13010 [Candidatus Lokiarchaeota archaeon]|nr:hypothetical protein [Candidatus Lokiarchaeota archaeon]MBD3342027.1 hypothetical protein [Candidatus Lokiarchaeota archaeon]
MVSEDEIEMFAQEVEAHLTKAEDEIIKFEKDIKNRKPIQELYYSIQALKALTPMVGLNNLSKLCNQYELILEKNKDPKNKIDKIDKFINLIFDFLELFRLILEKVKKGIIEDINEDRLTNFNQNIEDYESEYDITFINPIPLTKIDSFVYDHGYNFYKVSVEIKESCKFKKVRLYFIFRALNNAGRICWSNPEPEILENAEFEFKFEVYYASKESKQHVVEKLEEILEIKEKLIEPIKPDDFKQIITNSTLKWQKAKQKIEKLKETSEKIESELDINFIFPITQEEFKTLKRDKKNIYYYIYVRISLSCKNRKTRLFYILKKLDELGHICWSNPDPSSLQKGDFNLDFELYLISHHMKLDIIDAMENISEVDRKFVREMIFDVFERTITLSIKPQNLVKKEALLKEEEKKPVEALLKAESKISNKVKTEPIKKLKNPNKAFEPKPHFNMPIDKAPQIIFTEKVDHPQSKIIKLPSEQFIKMIIKENIGIVFSCYKDPNDKKHYLYLVKEGFIFIPSEDIELFENFYNVDKTKYSNFFDYLASQRN